MAFGPFTLHMYALCILLGIIVALRIGAYRFERRGGDRALVYDCALVSVPAGIVGGRLYHVITSPDAYFGAAGHPWDALKIWQGGMGIWGAVALGTLGAYLVYRRRAETPPFALFADALAPGLVLAQAIGRWGNWFNGELFGRPLHRFWALSIPLSKRPPGFEGYGTFHPTFLYESLWCVAVAIALIVWERHHIMVPGSTFAGYIFLYCIGRAYCEELRIDPAHLILGMRLNFWVALILGAAAGLRLLVLNRILNRIIHRKSTQAESNPSPLE